LQILKTACNRDCPDACGVVAHVENGRVTRLQGDNDHPVTRGFLCHRTSRFLERQYDPDRVTTPLRRCGDEFHAISWDDALDEIAERMLTFRDESGPAAIMHYRSGGSLGLMKHISDYFFERFGPVTIKSGDICSGAGEAAQTQDFGECDSHDLFDLLNSKTIVLWGKNPYVSNVHLLPVLKQARNNGARLVLIDPVYHRTADLCELYLQPRPGGDLALALGVARMLFERGAVDPQAAAYCDHCDDFRRLAMSRSLDDWASAADVPRPQLDTLATAYADGPAAILVGWGMQRRTNGSTTIRAVDALAAISGNLGVAGGGVSFYFKRRGAFDTSFIQGQTVAPRTIPETCLGPGLLAATDPPVRMVWVTAGNPVAMLPQSRTVAEALESRELTVVVDSFLTDSARCAHLVLPTTTMLEDDDLLGAYGHHWLIESRPVVQAPEGVKTDYEIVQQLACRVGLGDEFADSPTAWKTRLLGRVASQGASLEDLRDGAVRNPLSHQVLFAARRFNTPSGRVDLLRQANADAPRPPAARPLFLTALSTASAQSSQWVNGVLDGPLTATVHPESAAGFTANELVRVQSEIGEMTVRLALDDRQRRDVLLIPKGGWLRHGHCGNALVQAQETDAGGCAVYYDTPVRLLPIDRNRDRSNSVQHNDC